MTRYEPEGKGLSASRRQFTLKGLRRALDQGTVLEAIVTRCDQTQTLWLDLGDFTGWIPREEAACGEVRDIAVLSRVGRPVCFRVTAIDADTVRCSRRLAQEEALEAFQSALRPGDVIPALVVGLARFGAFCDIGRGVTALLPTGYIAVARSRDAAERFTLGQELYAVVRAVEGNRFVLSHRELLGSWRDNAAQLEPGKPFLGLSGCDAFWRLRRAQTKSVRSLRGPEDLHFGDRVSVYIKSIQPEGQKIKLSVVAKLPPSPEPPRYQYIRTSGHMDFWQYAPALQGKEPILTCF